jgi:chromosome partitioning protein
MRVWSVVSQKGGSGKTTLLLCLAILAMELGLVVTIIDLDPQRSAEQWSELREKLLGEDAPTVVHGLPTGLDGMLEAARTNGVDLVLIDSPPAIDDRMVYAAFPATLVIVPTRIDVLDQLALRQTLDYLYRLSVLGKSMVVVNAPSKDKKGLAETVAIARDEFEVAVLDTVIENTIELAKALKEGRGVTELKSNSAAAKKARATFRQVYDQLTAFEGRIAKQKPRRTA